MLWAFAGTETVGILASKPSLVWFRRILLEPEWQGALAYSAILAIVVSSISSLALLLHFYFMRYAPPIFDHLAYASVLIVILIPAVAYALALRMIGATFHLPEMVLLFMGHMALVIPIQFFVLESKQETVPSNLLFAGSTLGASHIRNLRFVYAPLILDAIIGAFIVGFFLSFDELVIATFIIDSPRVTVPKQLWDQVNRSMDPAPAVISCLIAGAYLLTLLMSAVVGKAWGLMRARR
jgi:ABC-type spermidine/putrescine transport system permease subunit II